MTRQRRSALGQVTPSLTAAVRETRTFRGLTRTCTRASVEPAPMPRTTPAPGSRSNGSPPEVGLWPLLGVSTTGGSVVWAGVNVTSTQ